MYCTAISQISHNKRPVFQDKIGTYDTTSQIHQFLTDEMPPTSH